MSINEKLFITSVLVGSAGLVAGIVAVESDSEVAQSVCGWMIIFGFIGVLTSIWI